MAWVFSFFLFFFTHLVKSCQSFQTWPQTSSTREITCQTPSVKLVLIPTCPICWPQTIHGQYTGPTSWVALASLHQVKHFCLAHGSYVRTIDTKQNWTQPGSIFFLLKVLGFFYFELPRLKISKLCSGLKAVDWTQPGSTFFLFFESFRVFLLWTPKT